jgi:hypothetical protein
MRMMIDCHRPLDPCNRASKMRPNSKAEDAIVGLGTGLILVTVTLTIPFLKQFC